MAVLQIKLLVISQLRLVAVRPQLHHPWHKIVSAWVQMKSNQRGDNTKVVNYVDTFLDALASLRPILFSKSVLFFGFQITSESISENVIGLCQYHKYQC